MDKEDPLLRRTRIEAANAMANAVIDTMNEHIRTHGKNDPDLDKVLIATLMTVVTSIEEALGLNRLGETFGEELADNLIHMSREDDDDDEDA